MLVSCSSYETASSTWIIITVLNVVALRHFLWLFPLLLILTMMNEYVTPHSCETSWNCIFRRSSKFSVIGSPCWSCNLVLLGLIFLLKPKGNICIFLPGLNMSKSGLSQKERETNRIQMWHLALHHVRPNLRSQTDYRGAMSQHF